MGEAVAVRRTLAAARHRPSAGARHDPTASIRKPRLGTSGMTVIHTADATGYVSFVGTGYRAGWAYAGTAVEVSSLAASVQLALPQGGADRPRPPRRRKGVRRLRHLKGRRRKNKGVGQVPEPSAGGAGLVSPFAPRASWRARASGGAVRALKAHG